MTSNEQLLRRRDAIVPSGVGKFHASSVVVRGEGALVWDADGRELIDFASGIGTLNVGHCHPAVVEAVQSQVAKLTHNCVHVGVYEEYVALCERLAELFPHGDATKVLLVNTGAEAVENGIKIARQATKRQAVICFTEGFHGRTMMALTLTSKTGYKAGCGPFAAEVYRLQYPNHFRYGDGLDMDAFVARELDRFRLALVNTVDASQVACVIIEPVQGEGGFVPAPTAYLKGLREICDAHGILLIIDEVQTGFGRTGAWAAYQHSGVTPDISTWAKSLGGGLPISAVIGRKDVMDSTAPSTLGGTYGGNPVACAAALAAIDVIEKEGLNERAMEIGRTLRLRFEAFQDRWPGAISNVRGMGAMQAIRLDIDGDVNRPASKLASDILARCLENGLLLITAGTFGNVIRVLSPLVITDEQLNRGLDILEEALESLVPAGSGQSRTPQHA